MTLFWIVAAALVALVLAVLLRPLMKPARALTDNTAQTNRQVLRAQLSELEAEHAAGRLDAEQHAAARAEIERRVLEEGGDHKTASERVARAGRGAMAALVIAVPVAALALYLHLGSREAMDPAARVAGEAASPQDMAVAIARLAEKLKAQPEDAEGWALLGRSYAQVERFDEAREAYANALKHGSEDAPLLADYVDAIAMSQGRQFSPDTERLLARALALDPNHLKSLALAGAAAMARGDHATAVALWTRASEQAPPDSELAQGLAAGIAQAQARLGAAPAAASAARPAAQASSAAAAGVGLRVAVRLAPALAAQVKPGDTVFVFARAADGPRMPLAIARLNVASLPTQVQLDDTMAMTPQMRLSSFQRVVIAARVSKKGNATPEAGDLEGESAPQAPSGTASVTIDRVRP